MGISFGQILILVFLFVLLFGGPSRFKVTVSRVWDTFQRNYLDTGKSSRGEDAKRSERLEGRSGKGSMK